MAGLYPPFFRLYIYIIVYFEIYNYIYIYIIIFICIYIYIVGSLEVTFSTRWKSRGGKSQRRESQKKEDQQRIAMFINQWNMGKPI